MDGPFRLMELFHRITDQSARFSSSSYPSLFIPFLLLLPSPSPPPPSPPSSFSSSSASLLSIQATLDFAYSDAGMEDLLQIAFAVVAELLDREKKTKDK